MFNRYPWLEDYDVNGNYLRILFRPGRSLQVRELNNIQSMFDEQIRRFSSHFFKNGTRISGGQMNHFEMNYIILKNSNKEIAKTIEPGDIIKSLDGVEAVITHVETTTKNEISIFFRYIKYSDDRFKVFKLSDLLHIFKRTTQNNPIYQHLTAKDISKGIIFQIEEGVFFYQGNLIETQKQTIVISYDNNILPKYKIGFDVVEEIISYKDNDVLLDNAIGFQSYQSPGADRHKISFILTKRRIDFEDSNFITLAKITDNGILYDKKFTEYSEFGDYLAKRTFEESGNYTITPIDIKIINHKAKSHDDPLGYKIDGDDNKYVIKISPHISYVNGYRIEKNEESTIIGDRGNTSKILQNQKISPLGKVSSFIAKVDNGKNANVNIINPNVIIDLLDENNEKIGTAEVTMVLPDIGLKFRYIVDNVILYNDKKLKDIKKLNNNQINFSATVDNFEIQNWNISPYIIKLPEKYHIENISEIKATIRKKYVKNSDNLGYVVINTEGDEKFDTDHDLIISVDIGAGFYTNATPMNINFSDSQIGFGLDQSFANKQVIIEVNVIKNNIPIKTKNISRAKKIIHYLNENFDYLLHEDTIKIIDAYFVNKTDDQNKKQIDLNDLELIVNQKQTKYTTSRVKLKPELSFERLLEKVGLTNDELPNYSLVLIYNYLSHSSDPGVFTIDSYTNVIQTYQNHNYITPSGEEINLLNSIDFRPTITINNEVKSPSFKLNPFKNITFNTQVKLPRKDLIAMKKTGEIYIRYGIPHENPVAPEPYENDMGIFELYIDPKIKGYEGIIPIPIYNRRYTMKDIGNIEKRINNAEYYVTMNLLEKSAESMKIKDSQGRDRFKNGFVADDFSKYQAADIGNDEFRSSFDRLKRELRPNFISRYRKLKFNENNSKNFVNKNGMIIIDYDEIKFDEQPFATKKISINPYLVPQKKGQVILDPNFDMWVDTKNNPSISFTVDNGSKTFIDAIDKMGVTKFLNTIEWGSWRPISKKVVDSYNTGVRTVWESAGWGVTAIRTVKDTVEIVETEEIKEGKIRSLENQISSEIWENVTDIKYTPYIRPIEIKFIAKNLAPKTRHFVFFDEKNVTESCRPINGNWGDTLITTETGELEGIFKINEKKFFIGEKEFIIATTNDIDKINDQFENWSTATTKFFAGGLDVKKQKISMNVLTPTMVEKTVTESRTKREEAVINRILFDETLINQDPIAQSFTPPHDLFLTSIELFFATLDEEHNDIWIAVRKLENGYPISTNLAFKKINTKTIRTSEDGSIGTKITFDFPVFCEGGKEYCFIIGGASPNTRIWIARMGDPLINDPTKFVETQPSLGSSFRSQNASTWTAEQFEDVKYILYCAKFKHNELVVGMDQINEYDILPKNPFECQEGDNTIRVYFPNHGLKKGDKFIIRMFDNTECTLKLEKEIEKIPIPGMIIESSTGKATITDVNIINIDNDNQTKTIKIKISDVDGYFFENDNFICYNNSNNFSQNYYLIKGLFLSTPPTTVYGFPVEMIVGKHTVFDVDTADTFLFKVSVKSEFSERFGGDNVKIFSNMKYDAFSVFGTYLPYNSEEKWSLIGIYHNRPKGIFEDYDYRETDEIVFIPGNEVFLEQPFKIANDINEIENIKNGKSINISAKFKTNNEFISPVLNLNTFGIIAISNQIDWLIEEEVNTPPFPLRENRYKPETSIYGMEPYKYVTRQINLSKPAKDLVIAFDVYKDKNADFDVYYKLQYQNKLNDIDTDNWNLLPIQTKIDSSNQNDRIEYELTLSKLVNTQIENFVSFKIKLVGRSKNTAKPPIFKNFRAIAVT